MEPNSPIAPRPRPGFRSRPAVTTHEKAALVATTARALLGVLCLGVAVLYLPPQQVTPILSGVSVLMVVSGSYTAWQLGRRAPLLRPYARLVYMGAPGLALLVFLLLPLVGAGGLGPDWSSLAGAR